MLIFLAIYRQVTAKTPYFLISTMQPDIQGTAYGDFVGKLRCRLIDFVDDRRKHRKRLASPISSSLVFSGNLCQ
jgi:hypothetical protein